MRRLPSPAAVFALLLTFVPAANAQINLSWNDCITQPTAAANLDYACNGSRDSSPFRMVPSFLSPANLSAYVGMQLWIDVETGFPPNSGPPLPDFWKLASGECRDAGVTGAIQVPTPFSGVGTGTTGVCQDPYAQAATAGGFLWTSGTGGADRARLAAVFVRDSPTQLSMGQQYVATVIAVDPIGDVPNGDIGMCNGCCESVFFVVEQMNLYQVAGTPPQDIYSLYSGATRQWVSWQGSHLCTPTPVQRKTWGSIKSLYR